MTAILITGISGVGKTTAVADLAAMGWRAFDLDSDGFSTWVDVEPDPEDPDNEVRPGQDWMWREERVRALLGEAGEGPLFASGSASNMGPFLPRFDHVVLLTAPEAVIVRRLLARTGDAYGQAPEEIARVLRLKQTIEPRLRRVADMEIDTSLPGQSVPELILRHAGLGG